MSSNAQDLQRSSDVSWASVPSSASVAWNDIWQGLHKSWFWGALAMQDIRLRYRGSIIGPFWLTLSMAIMIAAMGFLYSKLFNQDTSTYLPFLTTGLIVWNFISGQINEGCQTFIGAQSLIQSVSLPYSIHVYRQVMRGLIMLAHNLVILPYCSNILSRSSYPVHARSVTGIRASLSELRLGCLSPWNDQCALSRCAAYCAEFRHYHFLRDANLFPSFGSRSLARDRST